MRRGTRFLPTIVGIFVVAAGLPLGSPPAVQAVSTTVVINEVDYDQAGTDAAEFLELKNVGSQPANLAEYAVELVNASTNTLYTPASLVLSGTLAAGDYFVICANNSTTANCDLDVTPDTNLIQNGDPDAIGLRHNGTLIDALSYGGNTAGGYTEGSGVGLDDNPDNAGASLSRCADGADTDQNNVDFVLRAGTPGTANDCPSADDAPQVSSTSPADGSSGVAVGADIDITFSEPVTVTGAWYDIDCFTSGSHTATVSGGPTTYSLDPDADFASSETCDVAVLASAVADQDGTPTPMAANHEFDFATEGGPESLPFSQDWSDTGMITANDDWSGVPGIVGYLGQNITTLTGADPQTLLAESTVANDVDVIANQTNTAITNGGVAEFHIANPVVALQGSGTADAPNIVASVSTTGAPSVTVSYSLRDIDGTADNSAQQVALQYRIGDSGAFTNVPAGYVADASVGPSATQETVVTASLPADAADKPLVQVRVITSNAVGNDEWIGIDDISIIAGPPPDTAPSVASTTPEDRAVNVPVGSNLSVTFSEPVNVSGSSFTIVCSTSGAHSATVTGGPTTYTLDPDTDFAQAETCDVTVAAANVSDQDSNDPPDNMAAGFAWSFETVDPNFCATTFTHAYQIQGSGNSAALTGERVTQGVVTGDFDGPDGLSGFYLQDISGDADTSTSDGIFVLTAGNVASSGQVVRVRGSAGEVNGETAITATGPGTYVVDCGTTNSVTPADVQLPFANATYLERFEGMLVRFTQPLVISEYFNYERFGEMVLALPLPGETRAFTPTSLEEPGPDALARANANALRRITLDDGLSKQNPETVRHPNGNAFSLANRFRGGDTVQNAIGVLSGAFAYKIQPTAPATYTAVNHRTAAPPVVGGRLRVAAMNTLNFFLTLDTTASDSGSGPCGGNANLDCRGADADQPAEFDRQRDKLIAALAGLNADVIGLNELENTPGVDPLGDPTRGIVAGLNATFGAGTYGYIDTGVIGTDAIRVGLVYRATAVQPVGGFEILNSADDSRFNDGRSRPVLAQTFEELATGARFTVAVNHLKSKGSGCGAGDDDTSFGGQGNCNLTRQLAAQALVDWLATDPTGSGDPDFLILGDLNSYALEDPIDAVRAGADDLLGTGDDYTNLIAKHQGRFAYSYVFDGQAGYLDHALGTASMETQVSGAADWHINADEPDFLDYDTTFKSDGQDAVYEPNAYRSSDHDPVVVGLDLDFGTGKVTGSGSFAGGSFAVEVEYEPGATVATGSTTFALTGGDIFTATSYDWLVVSGKRASYQGVGTLNGDSGYRFHVSVRDGGSPGAGRDGLRLIIWEMGGGVVYDSHPGAQAFVPSGSNVTSGNLVVHKPR